MKTPPFWLCRNFCYPTKDLAKKEEPKTKVEEVVKASEVEEANKVAKESEVVEEANEVESQVISYEDEEEEEEEEAEDLTKSIEEELNKEDKVGADDDILEINLDIEEIKDNDTIHLKEKTEVYYQMYREARQKAKLAKSLALSSYLEARRIKNLYMLDDIDDSDESDLDEK